MLDWTITFLIIAIISGLLGFTAVAGTAIGIAKTIFFISMGIWVASIILKFIRGKKL